MISKVSFFIAVLFALISFVSAQKKTEEPKQERWTKNMWDKDSEFMKGFETGIYLRTSGGKIEEYGCEMPTDDG